MATVNPAQTVVILPAAIEMRVAQTKGSQETRR